MPDAERDRDDDGRDDTNDDTGNFSVRNVLAFDNGAASHAVSVPEASSFAALVVPAGHDTHAFADTYAFAAHNVASHVVSVARAVVARGVGRPGGARHARVGDDALVGETHADRPCRGWTISGCTGIVAFVL